MSQNDPPRSGTRLPSNQSKSALCLWDWCKWWSLSLNSRLCHQQWKGIYLIRCNGDNSALWVITPTEWEKLHLSIILITSNVWNPTEKVLHPEKKSRESIVEIQTIWSLTSGITKRQINSTKRDKALTQIEQYGETKIELGMISSTYNPNKEFCNWLILVVNIATAYWTDINKWSKERRRVSSITVFKWSTFRRYTWGSGTTLEYWPTDNKRYCLCNHRKGHQDGDASNDKTRLGRSPTLTLAATLNNMVHWHEVETR
jgi:hypothetical protein